MKNSINEKIHEAKENATSSLIFSHEKEKLKLREDHLNELVDLIKVVDPEKVNLLLINLEILNVSKKSLELFIT